MLIIFTFAEFSQPKQFIKLNSLNSLLLFPGECLDYPADMHRKRAELQGDGLSECSVRYVPFDKCIFSKRPSIQWRYKTERLDLRKTAQPWRDGD